MLFLKHVLNYITGLFKLFKTAHCLQDKILILVDAQSTYGLVLVHNFQSLLALGFHVPALHCMQSLSEPRGVSPPGLSASSLR